MSRRDLVVRGLRHPGGQGWGFEGPGGNGQRGDCWRQSPLPAASVFLLPQEFTPTTAQGTDPDGHGPPPAPPAAHCSSSISEARAPLAAPDDGPG